MYTIEEVAEQLKKNVPDFVEDSGKLVAIYGVFVNENGDFRDFQTHETLTFKAERDITEFKEDESPDRVYETETLDNPGFYAVCEDIMNQLNKEFCI